MDYQTITVERDGSVAILTFNRPKVLNAFDPTLVAETGQALETLGSDARVSAIVVRGAGRAFSAGFDLKAGAATAGQRGPEEWRRVLEADFRFIMDFWDCPKPTIAAVHGYCIGGAFELALEHQVRRPRGEVRLGCGGAAAALDRRPQSRQGIAAHR
jgi:enoyl-CoA hydratase/carnithine racemase